MPVLKYAQHFVLGCCVFFFFSGSGDQMHTYESKVHSFSHYKEEHCHTECCPTMEQVAW